MEERRNETKSNESVNATVVRSPCGYVKYSPVLITLESLVIPFDWIDVSISFALCNGNEYQTATKKHHFAWFDGRCFLLFILICAASTSIKYTHRIHRPLNWTFVLMLNANVFIWKRCDSTFTAHHTNEIFYISFKWSIAERIKWAIHSKQVLTHNSQ